MHLLRCKCDKVDFSISICYLPVYFFTNIHRLTNSPELTSQSYPIFQYKKRNLKYLMCKMISRGYKSENVFCLIDETSTQRIRTPENVLLLRENIANT